MNKQSLPYMFSCLVQNNSVGLMDNVHNKVNFHAYFLTLSFILSHKLKLFLTLPINW